MSLTEDKGVVSYLGKYTSSIMFNVTSQAWHWRDMKREGGLAVRTVETCHEKQTIDNWTTVPYMRNKHCEVLVSCSDWVDLIELHDAICCQKLS